MPKQKKITKRLKAIDLTKPYIKAGFNQSKLARERGVNRATINAQVHKPEVVDQLQAFLDSPELDKKLIQVAEDGLKAMKDTGLRDHNSRFRFWNGLMEAKGKIRDSANSRGISIVNVIYGHRKPKEIDIER